jgi:hypothetical protein
MEAEKSSIKIEQLNKLGEIEINGSKVPTFKSTFEKIMNSSRKDLLFNNIPKANDIHGDLTIDNMLINIDSNSIILIDPSHRITFQSKLFDHSRLFQSLRGGYEFISTLNEDSINISEDGSCISYFDSTSLQYHVLLQKYYDYLKNTLPTKQYQLIPFFASLFYIRMLPHRLRIDSSTAPIYYAKASIILNEFFESC